MTENKHILRINTDVEQADGNPDYSGIIHHSLQKVLPKVFLEGSVEDQKKYLNTSLPLIVQSSNKASPLNISFFLLAKMRTNAFKFFFEMISRWLIPGKRLNVPMMFASDFSLPDVNEEVYTICEVVVQVESQAELEELIQNFPNIEKELGLGVDSSYYSRRIMEVKGVSSDEKTTMIQEYIAYIVGRLPNDFGHDVFSEMQHVLVTCSDEFKSKREVKHLSRIICVQYLFRISLNEAVEKAPEKRHLSLKVFKAKLNDESEKKPVLAVLVGINFIRDKEILEEAHLIKAIQNYLPQVKAVKGSFFINRRGSENICTLYLEIEKEGMAEFNGEEIRLLRNELPVDLEGRIEHMMHPVFMPRNEEEIMRNILSLSNQIKYLRDIPQMFVSFDEQTHSHLFFTIIIVRVVNPGIDSISDLFEKSDTFLDYIHDRTKTVGYLRKKYQKEVTVFRVKLTKEQFLRHDHSIDLYKARQSVVSEVARVVGDVRDYNGGMISKQNELLGSIRNLLSDSVKYNDHLLENFFFSLNPVIMRSVLEPEILKKLFLMLVDAISEDVFKGEDYSVNIRAEPSFIYVMVTAKDRKIEEVLSAAIEKLEIEASSIATTCVTSKDTPYLGYLYRCDDPLKQRQFCVSIQNNVEAFQYSQKELDKESFDRVTEISK